MTHLRPLSALALLALFAGCKGDPAVDTSTDSPFNAVDNDLDGSTSAVDCDDNDPEVNPAATEVFGDGIDNDCDGFDGIDADGDGWASTATGGIDCDDTTTEINPFELDIPYNGVDEDCDGSDLDDLDGDGDPALEAGGGDCKDLDPTVSSLHSDIPYNSIDEDCDGADLLDADLDGHDSADYGGDDCDDTDPLVSPSALDIAFNDIDEDCNGVDSFDGDYDGHDSSDFGGDDCDDADPLVFPSAIDWADDGVDSDCDGVDTLFHRSATRATASIVGDQAFRAHDGITTCDLDHDGRDELIFRSVIGVDGALILWGDDSDRWTPNMQINTAALGSSGDEMLDADYLAVFPPLTGGGPHQRNDQFPETIRCGDLDGDGHNDLVMWDNSWYELGLAASPLRVHVVWGSGDKVTGFDDQSYTVETFEEPAILAAAAPQLYATATDTTPFADVQSLTYFRNAALADMDGDGAEELVGGLGLCFAPVGEVVGCDDETAHQARLGLELSFARGQVTATTVPYWGADPAGTYSDRAKISNLSPAPDVNGDGHGDYLVMSGNSNSYALLDGLTQAELLVISRAATEGWFGVVGAADDFDGDGLVDLYLPTVVADASATTYNGGVAFFSDVESRSGTITVEDDATALLAVPVDGVEYGAYYQYAVDSLGDLNGDGAAEVAFTRFAWSPDWDASQSGVVHTVLDGTRLATATRPLDAGAFGFVQDRSPADAYSFTSWTHLRSGDFNGDGVMDYAISADSEPSDSKDPSPSYYRGRVSIFLSRPTLAP